MHHEIKKEKPESTLLYQVQKLIDIREKETIKKIFNKIKKLIERKKSFPPDGAYAESFINACTIHKELLPILKEVKIDLKDAPKLIETYAMKGAYPFVELIINKGGIIRNTPCLESGQGSTLARLFWKLDSLNSAKVQKPADKNISYPVTLRILLDHNAVYSFLLFSKCPKKELKERANDTREELKTTLQRYPTIRKELGKKRFIEVSLFCKKNHFAESNHPEMAEPEKYSCLYSSGVNIKF